MAKGAIIKAQKLLKILWTTQMPPVQSSTKRLGLFAFNGRVGRLRYFLTYLIAGVIFYVVMLVAVFGSVGTLAFFAFSKSQTAHNTAGSIGIVFGIIGFIAAILYIIIVIALLSKRFHDLDKSAWWILALAVPIWSLYIALGLLLQAGTEGPNRFGADPLPAGANHHDFLNSIGSSVLAKLILTIVIIGLIIFGGIQGAKNAPHSQSNYHYQYQYQQQMPEQAMPYNGQMPRGGQAGVYYPGQAQ